MPTDIQPMYDKLMAVINDIDEKLDSLDDSSGATSRKIVNELVRANQEQIDAAIEQISAQFANLDIDMKIAFVKGVTSGVEKRFAEEIAKAIDEKVKSAPKVEPLITAEEAEQLSKARSEIYQQIKMAVSLAKTMDDVDLEMPKTRRGSRGKRGVRAMSLMVWAINGTELDPQPKYKELALSLGFASSKDFTAFLKSKGVDTTNPEGDKLEVTLEDGRVLTGYIPEGAREKANESEEDSSDDEDDEDVVDSPENTKPVEAL